MKSNNKKNTFRFPFDIDSRVFLGLAVVCFILSINTISDKLFPRASVLEIKNKIEKDVNTKLDGFEKLMQVDTLLEKVIGSKQLSNAEFDAVFNIPYYLYFFQDSQLVFWNTNNINTPTDTFAVGKPSILVDKKGYYLAYKMVRVLTGKDLSAIAVIPIKNENNFNSDNYKDNYIVGDSENDFGIKLSSNPIKGALSINVRGAHVYNIYKNDDFLSINDRNGWRLFFNALPFIFFGISIHTYFKVTIKRKKPIVTFLILLSTAVIVRLLNYYFAFPTDFAKYSLFDPVFFATDYFNRSLGDTFINMCLLFWILLFYVVNVQGRIIDISKSKRQNKVFAGIVILVGMIALGTYLSNLTYEIINDSVIDFDTTLFSRLDLFSFIGILTFMCIFANFIVAGIITNNYLNGCFAKPYHKYILIAIAYVIFLIVYPPKYDLHYYHIFVCLVIMIFFLDRPSFKFKFDFNSYTLLLWIIIFSFGGAFFLANLLIAREYSFRKEFAEKVLRNDDPQAVEKLQILSEKIHASAKIKEMFSKENVMDIEKVLHYINFNFLWNQSLNYKTSIHLFDAEKNNLSPMDTLHYTTLQGENIIKEDIHEDTINKIYVLKSNFEKGFYVDIPIKNATSTLGHVVVKFFCEILDQRDDYSDFIFQEKILNRAKDNNYATAIYQDNILKIKTGFYFFPERITPDSALVKNVFQLKKSRDESALWYYDEFSKRILVVIKPTYHLYLLTTLFAYIFLIYFIVITLYILGNIVARSNLIYPRFVNLLSFNLRLRIHFAILLVVLVSFVSIGYFTSYFLIKRVKQKSISEISNLSQSVHHEIESVFRNKNIQTTAALDSSMKFGGNVSVLRDVALRYRINVNLFSASTGNLIFSSEPEVYNSGLLSTRINPLAKYSMFFENKENYINQENLGAFQFMASYAYIRNNKNEAMSIVQIPYISSNSEIKTETTTLLTTLINLYVFVFLISSLLALFISNSVSSPFKLIVKQFTQINLSKTNEPLKWNSSDEIGMLVKEYNRMLRKLENSSLLLAKNERELAWREMAKQVAHEIKNPLTPMKLSMQMLERAIKNKSPHVTEMTSKVAKTIVEQIDNLSVIATNFSNFAKLPEVKKEIIVLNEVLFSVTGMYNDSEDFEFLFLIPDYPIYVFADRGQLIRVFTNIIQNAIQSIPKGSKGNISLLVSKINNNFVRVSISDNGEGISKAKAKKLFQPYFTTKSSGTGLGLAMCKDIIEQFEGKIEFESMVNEGTTFHIDLPLKEQEDENEEVI